MPACPARLTGQSTDCLRNQRAGCLSAYLSVCLSEWQWGIAAWRRVVQYTMQMSKGGRVPIFLPISKVSILWEFFVLVYIIVDFVITMMVQCFESYYNIQHLLYDYFDRLLVPVLALDMLISLNTCVIKNGKVIGSRSGIVAHYVRSAIFWVDLGCLVLSVLQLGLNDRDNYSTAFNFLVFVKLVKVFQFDKNIKRYALNSFDALLVYEIIKNIVFLSLICYTLGAFIYLIDYSLIQAKYYPTTGPNPTPYWITSSPSLTGIIDMDLWVKISYSFYFIIVLLSGVAYGDLTPQNPIETFYVTLLMLFPLVIYSYVFNAVYNIISKKRERSKMIRKYQLVTKRYLQNLRVKKTLETKLVTYLTYIFKKTANDYRFIDSLAPSLKKKYLTHNIRAKFDFLYFEQLLSLAPLTNRTKFEDALMDIIREETFPERYKLIMPPNKFKLYYINQGICKRIAAMFPDKYSDKTARSQYFCYYPFLTGTCDPKLTYESASFVVAQVIQRHKFLQLLRRKDFYQIKQGFFLMRDEKVLYQNETVNGEQCFFCNSSAHMLDNCHHLRPRVRFNQHRIQNYRRMAARRHGALKSVYFRRRWHQRKVVLGRSPLYQEEESVQKCREAEVQCCEKEIVSEVLRKEVQLDRSAAYSVYYPEYNIVL